MRDLSILIPARNEMFLSKTIEDILANIEGNTEIIAVLDGYLPDPPLSPDSRCTVIYNPESIGQRASTNLAAKLSKAKYLMKCDAHCSFDKGFDRKMLQEMHDDWTMVPLMKNLHAFDWVCTNGHRRYQGPSGPCSECGAVTTRDILWKAKDRPNNVSYCFDSTPHFQYFGDFAKRLEGQGDVTETMGLQGSCFMLTRDKYWQLNVCDENFGSWGSQGIEVAVKTWLSGGRVLVNKKTWYAHMFRTQGGDFGFPYPMSGSQQERAKTYARDLFFNNNWPLQKRPLSWLVEKFWPVKGWTEADLAKLKSNSFKFSNKVPTVKPGESEPVGETPTKGIIYYTDSQLDEKIAGPVREQLLKCSLENSLPIVSSSLKKMEFGVKNIHFPSLRRGHLTMFKQILGALENSTADIVFFCEHDVLYHPTHFDFTPPKNDVYYYNVNVWKVRYADGHALKIKDSKQLSGLCASRELLIKHYRKRIEIIKERQKNLKAANLPIKNDGVSKYMGYEPGMHSKPRGVDEFPVKSWRSEYPNIDIRHDHNFSRSRWTKAEFQDKKYILGWTESTAKKIPGWRDTFQRLKRPPASRGIIYYTDSQLDENIARPVREQLLKISRVKNIPIVSASLKKMAYGDRSIYFPSLKRGYLTMFKQILGALENSEADTIFFCEHDVLYHPSHFDFIPPKKKVYYYNTNVWKYIIKKNRAIWTDDCKQLSGLCAWRELLIKHYRKLIKRIEKDGFSRKIGFEPGTHNRAERIDDFKAESWKSAVPNIDIRHDNNLTETKTGPKQFRNKKFAKGWKITKEVPGWEITKGNLGELLKGLNG